MINIRTFIVLIFFLVIAYIAKNNLFPSQEDLIREQLTTLSLHLTKNQGENVINLASKLKKAIDMFHPPLELQIHYGEGFDRKMTIKDKARVKESLTGFKFRYPWVNVRFEETSILVKGDQAESTGNVRLKFESKKQGLAFDLYHLKMQWHYVDGQWLIGDVEVTRAEP